MNTWIETIGGVILIGVTAAAVAFGARAGYKWAKESFGSEGRFEAHVDPVADKRVARNYGTIPRIAAERNIMAGQALGQTIDYSGGVEELGAGDSMDPNLSAYAAVLRGSDPAFGQNYGGRAVGQE